MSERESASHDVACSDEKVEGPEDMPPSLSLGGGTYASNPPRRMTIATTTSSRLTDDRSTLTFAALGSVVSCGMMRWRLYAPNATRTRKPAVFASTRRPYADVTSPDQEARNSRV